MASPRDTGFLEPGERQGTHAEWERARSDPHRLVVKATEPELRRRTDGTRWTNGQMLFHMVFGYMIVRRLLPLYVGSVACRIRTVGGSQGC